MALRDTSSGSVLEQVVINSLEKRNFILVTYSEYIKNAEKYSGSNIMIKNYPFDSIYNHKGKTEFLVLSEEWNLRIRIECKWQQDSGSVDEKFPYVYLNAIERWPEDEIIILYGGGGYKPGAIEWLKNAVSNRLYQPIGSSKNISVFSTDEFIAWSNRRFRPSPPSRP